MAQRKAMEPSAKKSASGFTPEERAAMRERVRELKARALAEDGERAVAAKIAAMPKSDRVIGERIHAIVKATAPGLTPRTWYGMPAFSRGERIVCFFRPAEKFKTRYATLGFSDESNLDEGSMWPTDFAITGLGPSEEAKIIALVKRAVSEPKGAGR